MRVRIEIKFPTLTKPKPLVLVAVDDPEYLSFLINSKINPFIANKPHMMQCQVPIDPASHNFLHHNSHIACHEVFSIKRDEVIKALMAAPSSIKGTISLAIRDKIKAAVKIAKTIDNDKKTRIISALEK